MRTLVRNIIIQGISYLLALLFIYTGVSKLLDIGIFQSQIAQSAMLAPYAKVLAWIVPNVELILAGIVLISRTRVWGLLGSAVLMLGFTIYVYLIWTYIPSLPCSCGGVLEAMDWEAHLYFNLGFTLLATWAWYLESGNMKHYKALAAGSLGVVTLVLVLFYTQPQPKILQDDSFTRNYRENTLPPIAEQKLEFNSYYVAGVTDSLVYLGNSTGFTHGIMWNYRTGDSTRFRIKIENSHEQFASLPKWQVFDEYFFIGEGVGPSLYRGLVGEWIAEEFMPAVPYYRSFIIIDKNEFILRVMQSSIQKHVLAKLNNVSPYISFHDVLDQQQGNLFETDGSIIWDSKKQEVSYLYFYKNKIDTWNASLSKQQTIPLLYNIDFKIQTSTGRDGTHLRETDQSPFHSKLRTKNNQYYVLSNIMGAEESLDDFNRNSTIDIYKDKYLNSIRLPNKNGEKASDFYVTDEHIIVHYPTQVVVYEH